MYKINGYSKSFDSRYKAESYAIRDYHLSDYDILYYVGSRIVELWSYRDGDFVTFVSFA